MKQKIVNFRTIAQGMTIANLNYCAFIRLDLIPSHIDKKYRYYY